MNVNQYVEQLKRTIKKLEAQNEFEVCEWAQELIRIIEAKDTQAYIRYNFDIDTLTNEGFFKKGMTTFEMSERVCEAFSLDNIFQYSIREGLWCPYERYAQGLHDIIKKIDWL